MRAVILAGGKGTRLLPYTTVLPKPLVPVGDRPILELLIRQLAGRGFTHIDLSVGHLGGLIKSYLDEIDLPEGLSVRYWWEDEPLGTAGAIRKIDDLDESFLVMNGDVLTTLDFAQLLRFHEGGEAMLTIALHRQTVDVDLGVIESSDGQVTDYVEKPKMAFDVSMGVYAYSPAAVPFIESDRFDFPELVKKLLAQGEKILTYTGPGVWFDIGTLGDYERAAREIEKHPELFDV
ncbi:MAG: nucleotidyltransferase family protein [Solirubrobacterales bacterium]|nr:nucleotidyltransferase family protein [Solirubrobacterales bacterium]